MIVCEQKLKDWGRVSIPQFRMTVRIVYEEDVMIQRLALL
jgi:hypothetical protein